MSDSPRPSYKELAALVVSQAAVIESLTARVAEQEERIARQEARIAELERQLGRNSRNSSLPPSSDRSFGKGKRVPRGSGRKPGKQPGAPGAGLEMSSAPDEIVDRIPTACAGCGADLTDGAGGLAAGTSRQGYVRRQRIAVHVTEHRLHRIHCGRPGCGHTTTAPAPAEVPAMVQYGPRLTALVAYLVVVQHLPYEWAVGLVADLCPGLSLSTGWACGAVARAGTAVQPACRVIADLLRRARMLHADETTTSVAGTRWWLHVVCTDTLTAFHLDPSCGRAAVSAFGIIPGHTGTLVHDALSVYDAYTSARHGLCGAHLLRELTAAAQAHPDQAWSAAASDALTDLLVATHTARDRGEQMIPAEILEPLLHRWHHAVRVGLTAHPPRPGKKQTPTRNLLQRLRDRAGQVLLFAHDLTVPFTNNQAERDLRPAKTQLKISGCHRSTTGARNWLAIRGYASTCRKNGIPTLTALRDALAGNPWKPSYAT